MRKEEKSEVIKSLADQLGTYTHFYLADISDERGADRCAA